MAYRSPGAYAQFNKTAGTVNSPGATRVMAIVGTGTQSYNIVNETLVRSSKHIYDEFLNANIFEVQSVTSKPLFRGTAVLDNVTYEEGTHYEIKDGKYIVWNLDSDPSSEPKFTITAGSTAGSQAFKDQISVVIEANKNYLVRNGKFRVEITYVDADFGTYRVLDEQTQESIGEYTISTTGDSNIIPGLRLTVTETMVPKLDSVTGNPILDTENNPVSETEVGDYVIIDTVAGKTITGVPQAGESFYVSYTYKKPESEYVPKIFTDYDDVVAEYGQYEVTASGKVINSLTLAAEIAFLNGASPIVLVQAKNDRDYEIKEAIDKLRRPVVGITNINTVVAISTAPDVGRHLTTHVTNMSLPTVSKERMAYIGAPEGEKYTDSVASAKNYSHERVVYVVPGYATKDVRDINTGRVNIRKVGSPYLAVAVAAVALRNDPAEPLTNKFITGFKDLGVLYTDAEMNLMAEGGCLVLTQAGSMLKVRHGITTSIEDVNSSEVTLVQIKDYVIEACRTTLGSIYIGNKLKPTVVGDIQSSLLSILNQFKGQQIILGYSGVSVKRSKLDPRQVDVKFDIEAVYPLNYINIDFGFSGVN